MATLPQSSQESRRPGRPRLSEAERARVHDRLLDAATELAVEQGFDACGLREIAARAEVSPAMIAYYFGDRQGLYRAMFQRIFDRLTERARTLFDGLTEPNPGASASRGSPAASPDRDRIAELVRLQVSTVAEDPWLPTLVMREVLSRNDSPLRDHFAASVGDGLLPMIIQWIEEEQASGRIRADYEPSLLALTLMSLTGFPFLVLPLVGERIGLTVDADLPDRLIEHNQKLLAHGIRARPEEER